MRALLTGTGLACLRCSARPGGTAYGRHRCSRRQNAEKARMPPPVVTLSALSAISGFFGAFLTSPFAGALIFIETTLEKGIMTWKAVLPSIVAATAGFAVFFMVSGSFIGSMFTLPPYGGFKDIDLIYAVGLGLIGGVCGIFFIILYKKMRAVFEPMEHQPVILGLIGGLGLGLAGMLFPLTLFMGSDQLQVLINNSLEVSLVLLFLLVLVKIVLVTFSFSTGFAGGYIFPGFFIGGTLGILVFRLFPFIPLAVCLVCVIAGFSVALLRSPIAIALIIAIVFEPDRPGDGHRTGHGICRELPFLPSVYEEGHRKEG